MKQCSERMGAELPKGSGPVQNVIVAVFLAKLQLRYDVFIVWLFPLIRHGLEITFNRILLLC